MNVQDCHPLHDRVLIEPIEPSERHCRIILPATRKQDPIVPSEGIVRACGPGERTCSKGFPGDHFHYNILTNDYSIPLTVQPGMRVLFWPTKTRMSSFEIEGVWKDCSIVYEEQNIEAILETDYCHVPTGRNHVVRPRVLGDRCLVRAFEPPSHAGLIVIPDSARGKEQRGEVLAVGPGARGPDHRRRPLPVSVGDTILLEPNNSECAFHVDGVTYRSVREHEIAAVL